MKLIRICVFVSLYLLGIAHAENSAVKPLFSVELPHAFPEAKQTFEAVKDTILKHYYTDTITEEALYWAAIQGMLEHVSPKENKQLAQIWTKDQYEGILNRNKGVDASFGIKSNFNPQDGSLTVKEVLRNSPADGILQNFDRILRIDGQELKGKGTAEINQLLNGEAGTEVKLTINRDVKIFDLVLQREVYKTKNLQVSIIDENIAFIELKYFSADISKELRKELELLRDKGISSLILDMRSNIGGVFSEALRVGELFVKEKSILLRTFNREKGLQNYVSSNEAVFDFNIAILIDSKTASSAEIVTGALKDQGLATVIGKKTFGKGVFENTFTLENEFRLKFIIGAMYTPKGVAWQGRGIVPDFLVDEDPKRLVQLRKLDITQRQRQDIALITAIKLLKMAPQEAKLKYSTTVE